MGFLLKPIRRAILYLNFPIKSKENDTWLLTKVLPLVFSTIKVATTRAQAQTITDIVRHAYFKTKLILPLAS